MAKQHAQEKKSKYDPFLIIETQKKMFPNIIFDNILMFPNIIYNNILMFPDIFLPLPTN